uniref:Epoxide hydrolase N-terminal domain-containing protein n=1 Tax=Anopheles epiroticus TaxID=199890 RepID=A0A182P364_9DIPT
MSFALRVFFVTISLVTAIIFKQYRTLIAPMPVPELNLKQYWGPGDVKQYKEDTSIKPFKVSYEPAVIDKLRAKLNDVPALTPPLEGVAFEYGFNTDRLKEIIKYWRTTYLEKWSEREQFLNKFPHYHTQIQGLNIHYIHVKPKVPAGTKVLPLLLLHGWPGSVREFYDIIPLLTTKSNDKNFVFEVIVPSLPGYGWSQGSAKKGLSPSEIAIVMKNLMRRVGFDKFYIQGGDWGSLIGNYIATYFQSNVLGLHLNMCSIMTPLSYPKLFLASLRPSLFIDEKYVDYYFPLGEKFSNIIEETGYMHIQSTKPDTIGSVLQGNPVGLAAYILEKFSTWTNPAYRNLPDGGLEKYFKLDSLLDNVMIYYLTDSITTSQRIYAEAFAADELKKEIDRIPTVVPTACAKFRYEIFQQPDWVLKDHFTNLVQSNHFDDGGHFAAMQLPEVLYKDVVAFVASILKQYRELTTPLPIPALKLDEYWGPGDGITYQEDTSIRPFNISYGKPIIQKLTQKLTDLPRFATPLENADPFEYGFNSNRLLEIVRYWREEYLPKWATEREPYLNRYPHFKTQIQGLDIHYIHVLPDTGWRKKSVLPILLLHGWPGSVREFYDIIPLLTETSTEREFTFEVIVPSLPGFGWSQGSAKVGFGGQKMAVIMKNLMERIGHKRFFIHGGDWGALITDMMGTYFPESVIGTHQSGCGVIGTLATLKTTVASIVPSLFVEARHIPYYFPLGSYFKEMILESGYMHLQATKPDTIGAALVGNPIGLAAYILEKFSTQTNRAFRTLPDGGLERAFSLDALLDNLMVYYLTDSIITSQRLYGEAFSERELFAGELERIPNTVPTACAKFRHDVLQTIDWALKGHYTNLVQSNHFEEGGHFSVMQLPHVVYHDIVQLVEKSHFQIAAMGLIARISLVLFGIFIAFAYKAYEQLIVTPRVPSNIEFFEYWGPEGGDPYGDSLEIVPFNISYPSEVIESLRKQLEDVPSLTAPLEGTAFQYGFNSERLQKIIHYWRTDYLNRWDEREAYLNRFSHFKTKIQGLDIHFIRDKAVDVVNPKRIVPLLLLHGWPGSVREFYDIIPMLSSRTSDKEYVFDVIVPSLPGYGWSQGASRPGLSTSKVAVVMKNLMARLGYKRFYIQGGDWGAIIGNLMAILFEKDILGVHLNMCMASGSPLAIGKMIVSSLAPSYFIEKQHIDFYHPTWPKIVELVLEGGYLHLQATKPDTIGTALQNNPVGLAAYILEKFSTWTNPANRDLQDGGLEKHYSLDALLDNVMIYYLTNSITTSQRLYAESFSAAELGKEYENIPTSAPAACAKFRHELFQYPDWILKEHFTNLMQSNHYDDGGHFAAMQLPEVLYKDIVQFVNRLYVR